MLRCVLWSRERRTMLYEVPRRTRQPDINEMAAAAAGMRANTRHFDELPLAMRHSEIDPRRVSTGRESAPPDQLKARQHIARKPIHKLSCGGGGGKVRRWNNYTAIVAERRDQRPTGNTAHFGRARKRQLWNARAAAQQSRWVMSRLHRAQRFVRRCAV